MDQKVSDKPQGPETSVFARRRLPRFDPHLWADKIEDWFARLTWHVGALWIAVGLMAIYIAFDAGLMSWLDAIGRAVYRAP